MISRCENDIFKLMETSFPDFRASKIKKTAGIINLNFKHERMDGFFERIFVELDKFESCVYMGITLSLNFFNECPLPPGPFGRGSDLRGIVSDSLWKNIMPFWFGAAGFKIAHDDLGIDYAFQSLLEEALYQGARPQFEMWAKELSENELMTILVEEYKNLEKKGDLINAEKRFWSCARDFNGTYIEGIHYSNSKLISQLVCRASGSKSWTLI